MIRLRVNGEWREAAENTTVAALLESLGRPHQWTAVEVNRRVVPRADYARTVLGNGDVVEIVSLVGGG